MTVYNFNLGIGWASSGVEYAQYYRALNFRQLGVDTKFIFTDFISEENVEELTNNIGYRDDECWWLYQALTDFKFAPTTYSLDELQAGFDRPVIKTETDQNRVKFFFAEQDWALAVLREANGEVVERVEYVFDGILARKDYFSYARTITEYFAPLNGIAQIVLRRYFNTDGSVAFDELIDGDQKPVYRFKDQLFYSKYELIGYFVRSLNLTAKDVIIIDRATGLAQEILENKGPAKVGVVVHADHFSEPNTNADNILWNNFYEYTFDHPQDVDFFITATEAQKEILEEQFAKYAQVHPAIYAIPVGSLENLKHPTFERRPHSIITASRLAGEKHIDWLVQAVANVHQEFPDVTLDIYGRGGEENTIVTAINNRQANDYIHLKGHQDLDQVYLDYQVYASASTSEGFGLTLLEAIGSGLAMVGFDVRYGNQTFIKDDDNGYLVPYDTDEDSATAIKGLTEGLLKLFREDRLEANAQGSYELAENYLTAKVEQRWQQLLTEVTANA